MSTTDSVNIHGADQMFPAGMELPVVSLGPAGGLKEHHPSSKGLRLVVVRGGMDDGVKIIQMTVADGKAQRVIDPPAHDAQPAADSSHAVADKARHLPQPRLMQVRQVVT